MLVNILNSLPCPQQPAVSPYPEPDKSNPFHKQTNKQTTTLSTVRLRTPIIARLFKKLLACRTPNFVNIFTNHLHQTDF